MAFCLLALTPPRNRPPPAQYLNLRAALRAHLESPLFAPGSFLVLPDPAAAGGGGGGAAAAAPGGGFSLHESKRATDAAAAGYAWWGTCPYRDAIEFYAANRGLRVQLLVLPMDQFEDAMRLFTRCSLDPVSARLLNSAPHLALSPSSIFTLGYLQKPK